MIMFFLFLTTAICYFYFNWQFFHTVASVLEVKKPGLKSLLYTFFLNYAVFTICSLVSWHLIINWMFVLVLLLFEMIIFFKKSFTQCLLISLMGTQIGLTFNILFRSLFSILLDVPLIAFDNNIKLTENMKIYPIIFGFLMGGLLFWIIKRLHLLKSLSVVLEDKKNLVFLISVLSAMQLYLCLNLLVYYVPENSLVLKLWSMKSSLFVFIGQCLSVFFSIRMGQIIIYQKENQRARLKLTEERLRERELKVIATTDPLTGCKNRYLAEESLAKALNQETPFIFCFADLDGLKKVNDQSGHEMGDRYLLAVTNVLLQACHNQDTLFRYGGDEFCLLLYEIPLSEAVNRLQRAQRELISKSNSSRYPFSMSISYGFSSKADGSKANELVFSADNRMYQMKSARTHRE